MVIKNLEILKEKRQEIHVGDVKIGGDNPITVQTMTNTLTTNVKETINKSIIVPRKVLSLLEFHVLMRINKFFKRNSKKA